MRRARLKGLVDLRAHTRRECNRPLAEIHPKRQEVPHIIERMRLADDRTRPGVEVRREDVYVQVVVRGVVVQEEAELTLRLVVRRAVLDAEAVLLARDPRGLALDGVEERDVCAPERVAGGAQVPQGAEGAVLHDGYEVERGEGALVPLEVG